MGFLELSKKRFSVRKFESKPIEKEKIEKILEAGNNSPTAINSQPQKVYVITSKEALKKVDKLTSSRYNAPCVIMTCYDKNENVFKEESVFSSVDATIVNTHMMLEATDLNLGSVWVASFDPKKAIEIFDLPNNIVPVALLPIGYYSENVKPATGHTRNKKIEDIVKYL